MSLETRLSRDRSSDVMDGDAETISVLLVDDHVSFHQMLAFMLDREPDIHVAHTAGTVAEGIAHVQNVRVAVVDYELPDGTGTEVIEAMQRVNPEGVALLLTGSATQLEMAEAIEAGASGYLRKSAGIQEIVQAVRCLGRGEPLFQAAEIMDTLRQAGIDREEQNQAHQRADSLSPRELDVLAALAHGLSDREIAERLVVQPETVRTHMVRILSKLGVKTRVQALVFAIRYNLVSLE